MHMTGYSNGGMFAYYLASLEPHTMGIIFLSGLSGHQSRHTITSTYRGRNSHIFFLQQGCILSDEPVFQDVLDYSAILQIFSKKSLKTKYG